MTHTAYDTTEAELDAATMMTKWINGYVSSLRILDYLLMGLFPLVKIILLHKSRHMLASSLGMFAILLLKQFHYMNKLGIIALHFILSQRF